MARTPSGFVVNAFTGTDGEGRGVIPDVPVEPAADVIQIAATAAKSQIAPHNDTP